MAGVGAGRGHKPPRGTRSGDSTLTEQWVESGAMPVAVIAALLAIGGVESNPGPKEKVEKASNPVILWEKLQQERNDRREMEQKQERQRLRQKEFEAIQHSKVNDTEKADGDKHNAATGVQMAETTPSNKKLTGPPIKDDAKTSASPALPKVVTEDKNTNGVAVVTKPVGQPISKPTSKEERKPGVQTGPSTIVYDDMNHHAGTVVTKPVVLPFVKTVSKEESKTGGPSSSSVASPVVKTVSKEESKTGGPTSSSVASPVVKIVSKEESKTGGPTSSSVASPVVKIVSKAESKTGGLTSSPKEITVDKNTNVVIEVKKSTVATKPAVQPVPVVRTMSGEVIKPDVPSTTPPHVIAAVDKNLNGVSGMTKTTVTKPDGKATVSRTLSRETFKTHNPSVASTEVFAENNHQNGIGDVSKTDVTKTAGGKLTSITRTTSRETIKTLGMSASSSEVIPQDTKQHRVVSGLQSPTKPATATIFYSRENLNSGVQSSKPRRASALTSKSINDEVFSSDEHTSPVELYIEEKSEDGVYTRTETYVTDTNKQIARPTRSSSREVAVVPDRRSKSVGRRQSQAGPVTVRFTTFTKPTSHLTSSKRSFSCEVIHSAGSKAAQSTTTTIITNGDESDEVDDSSPQDEDQIEVLEQRIILLQNQLVVERDSNHNLISQLQLLEQQIVILQKEVANQHNVYNFTNSQEYHVYHKKMTILEQQFNHEKSLNDQKESKIKDLEVKLRTLQQQLLRINQRDVPVDRSKEIEKLQKQIQVIEQQLQEEQREKKKQTIQLKEEVDEKCKLQKQLLLLQQQLEDALAQKQNKDADTKKSEKEIKDLLIKITLLENQNREQLLMIQRREQKTKDDKAKQEKDLEMLNKKLLEEMSRDKDQKLIVIRNELILEKETIISKYEKEMKLLRLQLAADQSSQKELEAKHTTINIHLHQLKEEKDKYAQQVVDLKKQLEAERVANKKQMNDQVLKTQALEKQVALLQKQLLIEQENSKHLQAKLVETQERQQQEYQKPVQALKQEKDKHEQQNKMWREEHDILLRKNEDLEGLLKKINWDINIHIEQNKELMKKYEQEQEIIKKKERDWNVSSQQIKDEERKSAENYEKLLITWKKEQAEFAKNKNDLENLVKQLRDEISKLNNNLETANRKLKQEEENKAKLEHEITVRYDLEIKRIYLETSEKQALKDKDKQTMESLYKEMVEKLRILEIENKKQLQQIEELLKKLKEAQVVGDTKDKKLELLLIEINREKERWQSREKELKGLEGSKDKIRQEQIAAHEREVQKLRKEIEHSAQDYKNKLVLLQKQIIKEGEVNQKLVDEITVLKKTYISLETQIKLEREAKEKELKALKQAVEKDSEGKVQGWKLMESKLTEEIEKKSKELALIVIKLDEEQKRCEMILKDLNREKAICEQKEKALREEKERFETREKEWIVIELRFAEERKKKEDELKNAEKALAEEKDRREKKEKELQAAAEKEKSKEVEHDVIKSKIVQKLENYKKLEEDWQGNELQLKKERDEIKANEKALILRIEMLWKNQLDNKEKEWHIIAEQLKDEIRKKELELTKLNKELNAANSVFKNKEENWLAIKIQLENDRVKTEQKINILSEEVLKLKHLCQEKDIELTSLEKDLAHEKSQNVIHGKTIINLQARIADGGKLKETHTLHLVMIETQLNDLRAEREKQQRKLESVEMELRNARTEIERKEKEWVIVVQRLTADKVKLEQDSVTTAGQLMGEKKEREKKESLLAQKDKELKELAAQVASKEKEIIASKKDFNDLINKNVLALKERNAVEKRLREEVETFKTQLVNIEIQLHIIKGEKEKAEYNLDVIKKQLEMETEKREKREKEFDIERKKSAEEMVTIRTLLEKQKTENERQGLELVKIKDSLRIEHDKLEVWIVTERRWNSYKVQIEEELATTKINLMKEKEEREQRDKKLIALGRELEAMTKLKDSKEKELSLIVVQLQTEMKDKAIHVTELTLIKTQLTTLKQQLATREHQCELLTKELEKEKHTYMIKVNEWNLIQISLKEEIAKVNAEYALVAAQLKKEIAEKEEIARKLLDAKKQLAEAMEIRATREHEWVLRVGDINDNKSQLEKEIERLKKKLADEKERKEKHEELLANIEEHLKNRDRED